jgi:phosphoribosylformimino-5-aminoimidazole carboxamide ribotide isomerase
MQFIPAIDLMDGSVVRLTKGEESTRKGYDTSPMDAALDWQRQGAKYIHIIDLDAAFGKTPNTDLILEIVDKLKIPIQMGGGIRSYEKATELLDKGVGRVILGSMAIRKPEETFWLLEDYGPERVVIALDHRNGLIAIQGWQETTEVKLDYMLDKYVEAGFKWFIVTNVDTDGMFTGPDVETFNRIASKASIIASGGVSQLSDLTELTEIGVAGVVVGKALYEGRFTVTEAIEEIKKC